MECALGVRGLDVLTHVETSGDISAIYRRLVSLTHPRSGGCGLDGVAESLCMSLNARRVGICPTPTHPE